MSTTAVLLTGALIPLLLLLGTSVTAYRVLIASPRRWVDIQEPIRDVQIIRADRQVDWDEGVA